MKLTKNGTMKIVQVYAPTSEHKEGGIEVFYEQLLKKAIHEKPSRYTMIIGDFNIKVGKRKDERETTVGGYGYGERNGRGIVVNFLEINKLDGMDGWMEP